MGLTIDINTGLHTGTKITAGEFALLPSPFVSLFPGDTAQWAYKQSAAAWETIDDDKLRNLNTSDTYLQATYTLQQAEIKPISMRIKASGDGLSGGEDASRFGIRLRGYTFPGISGGTLVGSAEMAFPMGDWPASPFEVSFTPTQPVYYLYAYIFTRSQPGTVTIWDAEIWDTAQAGRKYGVWRGQSIDRRQTTPVTGGAGSGLDPRLMAFYYGYLYNADAAWSIDHAVELLSAPDDIVIQEPGAAQFTDGTVRAARATAVMEALVATDTRVWGYTYCSGNRELATIYAEIDRCAAAGYYGMFIDEAGWSSSRPDMTRTKFNAIVDYCHSLDLYAWANSTTPSDVLSSAVDATYNPTGLATSLGDGDWILLESMWTRSDDEYSGETGSWNFAQFVDRWLTGVADAHALDVSVAALTFPLTGTDMDDDSDWEAAYLFAIACGVDGWWGNGTASDGIYHWKGRPAVNAGDTLVSSVALENIEDGLWLAETDDGVLQFTVTNSPTVRTGSMGVFTGRLEPLETTTAITTTADRVTLTWEVSEDKLTWEDAGNSNAFYSFARPKAEVESY